MSNTCMYYFEWIKLCKVHYEGHSEVHFELHSRVHSIVPSEMHSKVHSIQSRLSYV